MYREKKLERRRRDRQRMLARARRVGLMQGWMRFWDESQSCNANRFRLMERRLGKHADNLAICSCSMCGNARRHHGAQTRQEDLADLRQRDEY